MPAFAQFTTEAEIIYVVSSHYWTSQNRKSGVSDSNLTSFSSLQKDRYNTMRKTTSAKVCENVANLAQLAAASQPASKRAHDKEGNTTDFKAQNEDRVSEEFFSQVYGSDDE